MNLFVALAPVASTAHISVPEVVFAANHVKEIVATVVDIGHFYNFLPQFTAGTMALDALCAIVGPLCEAFVDIFVDESIDNVPRLEMGLPNFPAGQTWRTFVYYAQAINTGNFTLYDYGHHKNEKIYG